MDIGVLSGRISLDDDATGALKGFASNLDKIGSSLSGAGRTLTIGLTAPLVAAAGASLLLAGNFEMSMTRLVSLAGVSQDELEGVKKGILDLAVVSGIGPQALADAMTKVSSTVSDTSKALGILDTSAKLSAAGMGTALDVAGALTAVVNSYAASGLTAARAADILAQAVKDGGAEAKELAPVLANVVPIAAQMGVSFEEVAANLATLTKLGVPTAEAVTQLTSVMTALLKESDKGSDALATVGMTFAGLREEVKEKGLMETLVHLSTVFKGNETALTDVFGRVEALKNVMGTAGVQAGTYAEVLDNVKRSSEGAGVAAGMFEAVQGKQLQTWAQVSAAAQVVAIKLGDSLAPAMGAVLEVALPLIDILGKATDWFAKLPAPVQAVAIGFAALAAAAGPVLMVVGSIATGIASLTPLIPVMGAAFAVATGPIGLVALAITGLVSAVLIFRGHMADLEKESKLGKPLDGLKDAAGNALISIKDVDANMSKLGATASGPLTQGFSLTIDKYKEMAVEGAKVVTLTAEQVKAAADYKEKLAAVNLVIAEATRDVGNLTNEQMKLVASYTVMGLSNDQIATKLNVSELAVKRYDDALKATAKTLDAVQGASSRFETQTYSLVEALDVLGGRVKHELDGLDTVLKAEALLRDMKMKDALDTTSYQIVKVWEAADAEVAAFTGSGELRKRHSDAIMAMAEIEASKLVYEADTAMTKVGASAVEKVKTVTEIIGFIGGEAITKVTEVAANKLDVAKKGLEDTFNRATAQFSGSYIAEQFPGGANQGTRYPWESRGSAPTSSAVTTTYTGASAWMNLGPQWAPAGWVPPRDFVTPSHWPAARALGGPVSAGSPYIVGESGPELFTPGASGAISPNGGVTVNANVTVNYPVVNDSASLRALGKIVGKGIVKQMSGQGTKFGTRK